MRRVHSGGVARHHRYRLRSRRLQQQRRRFLDLQLQPARQPRRREPVLARLIISLQHVYVLIIPPIYLYVYVWAVGRNHIVNVTADYTSINVDKHNTIRE